MSGVPYTLWKKLNKKETQEYLEFHKRQDVLREEGRKRLEIIRTKKESLLNRIKAYLHV